MFAYLLHELPCACSSVKCVCACVCQLRCRLAPMWGSKSIIPATFTYHFTELYVQCKQRLSLHANEPVSHSLYKGSIHCQPAVLPAHRIWYPGLHAYSDALCPAILSLTFNNIPSLHHFTNSLCFLELLLELWSELHCVNVRFQRWHFCSETRFITRPPSAPPPVSSSYKSSLPCPSFCLFFSYLHSRWWHLLIVVILPVPCTVHFCFGETETKLWWYNLLLSNPS